jgi:hypothetical protein
LPTVQLYELIVTVTTSISSPRRSRWTIVLIASICFIPFAAAWYMAKNPQLTKERQRANYGHLIDPAHPFEYADFFETPLTKAEDLPEIKGRWVMLQIAAGPSCGEACRAAAFKTGQMRLMLNKEISRVRRLLLLPGQTDPAAIREWVEQDPTLIVVGMSAALRQKLQDAAGVPLTEGMLLLLDPFANAMMRYDPGFDPYGVVRDLQRLLRISQIG